MSTILAIGGGGFQLEGTTSPIDDYILRLTGKTRPRICLVATPSGDSPDIIAKFYSAFSTRSCTPSHLAFFVRDPMPGALLVSELERQLLAQDAIFVCGGNTRAALAVWREWGVDEAFRQALRQDTLLAGMSAGAMCWFEQALTDTYWEPGYRPIPGLGFLAGGCRVHYNDSTDQRPRLHAALLSDAVPPTLAIDDQAAVLFRHGEVDRVLSWRPGSAAYHLTREDGQVREVAYPSDSIGTV